MQTKIKSDPYSALLLKSTFVKFSSYLNTPMVRILQANSNDQNSVSKYYSGELVKFVKEVLQIIPATVFQILKEIQEIITKTLKKIPNKLKKSELKDLAQFEERKKLADKIYQVSVFTESILSMENYLLGVIEVNPKVILEDGIRKELINLIYK